MKELVLTVDTRHSRHALQSAALHCLLAPDYALQPSPYWTFNGRNLKAIYDAFHGTEDEAWCCLPRLDHRARRGWLFTRVTDGN